MCGISGVVGLKDVSQHLFEGIRNLEYRGYDSCGVALMNKTHLIIKKDIGDILESVYEKDYANLKVSKIGGNLKKHLKSLNKKMKDSASNLEFEEAAKIRDEIRKLEASELEITLNPKISQYNLKNKVYPKGRSTLGTPGSKNKRQQSKWNPKK